MSMTIGDIIESTYKMAFVNKMAAFVAEMQAMADLCFYERNDQSMTTHYLEKVDTAKDICDRFGYTSEVWQAAKKIYDFTNSGREGYTLKDGIIVRGEDE